ncbi:hypothetical protein [Ulvibacterium sp.]|uniref:hypothetical protein n=1 Tax=Ulvibacterium sp. TaxID=2665914 RepID=UPI002620C982|nr:hypothetical protein [Ulvibacterium sp.]
MEKDENKELDAFYKKIIQESGLEEPSANFTASVISKIQQENQRAEIFSYRPLIPRYVWWVSTVLLSVFFGFVFLKPENSEFTILPAWNLDFFKMDAFVAALNSFQLPDALVYGFLSLAIFISFQAYLLKTHWNKQFIVE